MSATSEQIDQLTTAIHTHDHLHRVMREIEKLQQVVFHSGETPDIQRSRRSAEQILVAEILSRYHGDLDGIYHALRKMEKEGKSWAGAIRDLAGYIHSYFTTPLGIIMRRDLFGQNAIFVSPDALDWIRKTNS